MDETLPLSTLESRLPLDRPFTRAMARASGVERPALERMLREGTVRRLVRGAYVAAAAPDTTELRATAVALVVRREAIAVDRTAAWVHGVDVTPAAAGELHAVDRRPLEVISPGRSARGGLGAGRQLGGHDIEHVAGLRLTTPLRTALDLGRLLPPGLALGAMDGLLSARRFTHVQLLAEVPRMAGHRGVGQLRVLVAQVDARSSGLAESTLRLHWHRAQLPTAVPGMQVCAAGRLVRLALGVERRQFGAVLADRVSSADLVALEGAGWRIVVLSGERVLNMPAEAWMRHLEREFHQQLLAQAG
jgi:putative AbiEi antitoxin of type IV toxin-antitoxin system